MESAYIHKKKWMSCYRTNCIIFDEMNRAQSLCSISASCYRSRRRNRKPEALSLNRVYNSMIIHKSIRYPKWKREREKPKQLGERNHLCKFYSRHQFLLLLSSSLTEKKKILAFKSGPVCNNNKHYEIYFYFSSINARIGRLGGLCDDSVSLLARETDISVQIEWILIMKRNMIHNTLDCMLWPIIHRSEFCTYIKTQKRVHLIDTRESEHSGRLFCREKLHAC